MSHGQYVKHHEESCHYVKFCFPTWSTLRLCLGAQGTATEAIAGQPWGCLGVQGTATEAIAVCSRHAPTWSTLRLCLGAQGTATEAIAGQPWGCLGVQGTATEAIAVCSRHAPVYFNPVEGFWPFVFKSQLSCQPEELLFWPQMMLGNCIQTSHGSHTSKYWFWTEVFFFFFCYFWTELDFFMVFMWLIFLHFINLCVLQGRLPECSVALWGWIVRRRTGKERKMADCVHRHQICLFSVWQILIILTIFSLQYSTHLVTHTKNVQRKFRVDQPFFCCCFRYSHRKSSSILHSWFNSVCVFFYCWQKLSWRSLPFCNNCCHFTGVIYNVVLFLL